MHRSPGGELTPRNCDCTASLEPFNLLDDRRHEHSYPLSFGIMEQRDISGVHAHEYARK